MNFAIQSQLVEQAQFSYTCSMIPTSIGRYEIKSELGRGGMATVYRGYDPSFGREVAVKVLPKEFLHDPSFLDRFRREIKIIAALEHPAIVPVYDVGEDNGIPFFVMRFMSGGSLTDQIKKGKFTLQDAAGIIERLAAALTYAHQKGVIHRDLKPDNILFDDSGDPYISDFGVASVSTSTTNLTGNSAIGTPDYMSPEQAQGEKVDNRSDIYGLGVIIFQMLSGELPYKADTPMGVAVKHITDPVPEILKANPTLPKATDTVIKMALAKNKDQRYPSATELAKAIRDVASEKNKAAPSPAQSTVSASSGTEVTGNKRNLVTAGIAISGISIFLIIVLAGAFFLKNKLFGSQFASTEVATTEATGQPEASQDYFTEDFNGDLGNNWKQFVIGGGESQLKANVDGGFLNFEINSKELHIFDIYTAKSYDNVRIDMHVENRGENNSIATMICRYDEEKGWYEFTVSNGGLYKIYYTKWNADKQNTSSVVIVDGASALIKGGKESNDYAAICNGRTLSLEINGSQARTVDDNQFVLESGNVGFGVASSTRVPAEIRIDSVSINQP